MTTSAWLQLGIVGGLLFACASPLGVFMARVYQGEATFLSRVSGPIERWIFRLARINPESEMAWKEYASSMLIFSLTSCLAVYGLQRLQAGFPLNPDEQAAVSPDSAFNTAISFATNTNWQGYGGETTMSYLTQMAGLAVQNFVSAAAGMAVLMALIRGFTRAGALTIGNFWADLVRGTVSILLPLSCVLALLLTSQGVVQTFAVSHEVPLLEPTTDDDGNTVATQRIAVGPAASQVAIKQLGTNGGGFFNTNSAHPLENPTPLTNLLELIAILLIPAALCITFGEMVGDRRQGWTLLAAMTAILVAMLAVSLVAEHAPSPRFAALGIDQASSDLQPGGNMEGKEARFGISASATWAVFTTAASNGSVNSMHDSSMPLGGLAAMWLIQLGEVVFGGVGSGLYGMIVFAIVAVFIAGLMVGRTPEYLGKKIGAFEMKMASLVILLPCAMVLLGTAVAVATTAGQAGVANPGPHGFSEILYGFSSAANNNGSAFAGLGANTPFYNGLLGLAMLVGRFWVMLPVLAMAGSIAGKKHVPPGPGTLPTDTPTFAFLLVAVVVAVGALSFFPALALGPIVEHLMLAS
jgi:K+-transporting ATPase ATPase A chain